jgi:hypothetical protein
MQKVEWILCPICKNKTRIRIRGDTILESFPQFCPKCKQETLINVLSQSLMAYHTEGNGYMRKFSKVLSF